MVKIKFLLLIAPFFLLFAAPGNSFAQRDSSELTWFFRDYKWGMADQTGREVVPPIYDYISMLANGLTRVNIGSIYKEEIGVVGGKWGLIDDYGRVVLTPKYEYLEVFVYGLARVNKGGVYDEEDMLTGGKWGMITTSGKVVIPAKYAYVENPTPTGLVRVNIGGTYDYFGNVTGGRWKNKDVSRFLRGEGSR
ncbi:MAG: WG repeat-containing protein [Bacteroidia bacterium]